LKTKDRMPKTKSGRLRKLKSDSIQVGLFGLVRTMRVGGVIINNSRWIIPKLEACLSLCHSWSRWYGSTTVCKIWHYY